MKTRWAIAEMGECAEVVRNTVTPDSCKGEEYIGLEHIGEGSLAITSVGDGTAVASAKSRFEAGDILFGKLRPYFRKVAIAPFDGVSSTDIWVVRAKSGTDQRFLFYRLASQEFIDVATRGAEGTKMPRAKWNFVEKFAFPLPPLPIQKRIAHILGTLDDKIELNRRMNETLEAMARAIFKSWFIDFDPVKRNMERKRSSHGRRAGGEDADALFPAEFQNSELGLIPKGWGIGVLGELLELAYGSAGIDHAGRSKCRVLGELLELAYGRALRAEARQQGTVPVFGSNGQIGWHSQPISRGPGIVVGRKGNPGVVIWSYTDFFAIDTAFYAVPRKEFEGCLHFLFHALREQDLASLGADSAVPGLNRNIAYTSKQLLPPRAILEQFEVTTATVLRQVNNCREELRCVVTLRDVLLPKLLSGELAASATEKHISEVT